MIHGSHFQDFVEYEMDEQSVEKIFTFPTVVMDWTSSGTSMIFCDLLLLSANI